MAPQERPPASTRAVPLPATQSPWVHPHVTLSELTGFVAAFLDLLLLASGLQTSARPFAWTPRYLERALAWADHLHQIMADIPASEEGLESIRTLDTALSNLTSSAIAFPAGLPRLTASDLSSARKIFLQALLQAVGPDSDYFDSITDSLLRQQKNEGEIGNQVKEEVSARNRALRSVESLKSFVESTVGCLILEEKKTTSVSSIWDRSDSTTEVVDESLFKAWASNAMEYVTAYTTVYKLAAANLIFKSREEEWRRVLDTSRAHTSSSMVGDDVANETEISELCCLQLAYSDCRDLAFRISSSPLNSATNLGLSSKRHECSPGEAASIETFLAEILEQQADLWWKLPPVLLAGVCASRFSMLKTYLQTLINAANVTGNSCKCSCHVSGKLTCQRCQRCPNAVLERLWWFAVQHPQLRTFAASGVEYVCNFLLNEAQRKVLVL